MRGPAPIALLMLTGCVIQPPEGKPHSPHPPACPSTPSPPLPRPVWPNSCVEDWYAKAALPRCVEDYLQSVKTQQEKIQKKQKKGSR